MFTDSEVITILIINSKRNKSISRCQNLPFVGKPFPCLINSVMTGFLREKKVVNADLLNSKYLQRIHYHFVSSIIFGNIIKIQIFKDSKIYFSK